MLSPSEAFASTAAADAEFANTIRTSVSMALSGSGNLLTSNNSNTTNNASSAANPAPATRGQSMNEGETRLQDGGGNVSKSMRDVTGGSKDKDKESAGNSGGGGGGGGMSAKDKAQWVESEIPDDLKDAAASAESLSILDKRMTEVCYNLHLMFGCVGVNVFA
ncbi:hypothetical protein HK102_005246 [Quaeritorhiza haematococci]|nr:hypothetical protein HK102_005246 [Quaeritorhiza haematococci]